MAAMLGDSMEQARGSVHSTAGEVFSVAELVADAARAAGYDAASRGSAFKVGEVDPFLGFSGHREKILAALANILRNAFKFTHPRTAVGLDTRADGKRIFIEVSDHCGGLPHGAAEQMLRPFTQSGEDRSGLGLGLSIARRSVEADGAAR